MATRKMEPEEIAFNQRINAVFLRKEDMPFEDVIHQYRQIEAEFILRAGDNQRHIVETKRRVTEWLLMEAKREGQDHDVCTTIWEELVERGFSDHLQKCVFTGIYARCCQENNAFHSGLAAVEPLIAEMEQSRKDATVAPEERGWYEEELASLCQIRDEINASSRG